MYSPALLSFEGAAACVVKGGEASLAAGWLPGTARFGGGLGGGGLGGGGGGGLGGGANGLGVTLGLALPVLDEGMRSATWAGGGELDT